MDPIKQKIFLFGSISFISYFLIFYYEEMVMHYFVLGSWHALLPISTAFLISIVSVHFPTMLLNILIEFKKKETKIKS